MRSLANVLGWSGVAAFLVVVSAEAKRCPQELDRAAPLCRELGEAHGRECACCAVMQLADRPFGEEQAKRIAQVWKTVAARREQGLDTRWH